MTTRRVFVSLHITKQAARAHRGVSSARVNKRKDLMWQAIIGFIGFFAFVAFVQAVLNLFRPDPAIWPGLLAGVLIAATWVCVRRWLRWRRGTAVDSAP